MTGERIRQARELCDLTQSELAERLKCAQSAIAQIEAGIYVPSEATLDTIAQETGFDLLFLKQPDPPANFPLPSFLFRSQTKVSKTEKAKTHRLAQTMFELALQMRKSLRDIPVTMPRIYEDDPVMSARLTRSGFGLSPDTPIANITAVLERAGVLILRLPMKVEGLDAFSAWVGPAQSIPVICLLQTTPGYRYRLTLSEEVGHLVMHTPLRVSVDQAEKEAKAFAGEFLFPEEAMRRELVPPITLASLAQAKHRWGTSINFEAVHASRIGIITPNQYRYLMQQIAMKGWRKEEQGDSEIVQEKPRGFLKMAEVVYGSPLDLNKIRKQTGYPISLLRSVFNGAAHKTDSGANLQLVKRTERKLA